MNEEEGGPWAWNASTGSRVPYLSIILIGKGRSRSLRSVSLPDNRLNACRRRRLKTYWSHIAHNHNPAFELKGSCILKRIALPTHAQAWVVGDAEGVPAKGR